MGSDLDSMGPDLDSMPPEVFCFYSQVLLLVLRRFVPRTGDGGGVGAEAIGGPLWIPRMGFDLDSTVWIPRY